MADQTSQRYEVRKTVDRSGSMAQWKDPVVEGINAYLGKLKADPVARDAAFKLVQWDSQGFDVLRNGKVSEIELLKEDEYEPRALTPLLDAIMSALTDGVEEAGVKYTLVIFTDGLENASKKYTLDDVKQKIAERRAQGWVIIFLGANIDAWKVAQTMGIPKETTMNVHVAGRNNNGPRQGLLGRLGLGGRVNPVVAGLTAAAGLGLAYMLLRPSDANAAAPAFSEADRFAAMGIDGTTQSLQDAVDTDVNLFDEPFKSLLDLPEELQQADADLPADFDPSLGSMGEDGNQLGGFAHDGEVTSADDVPATQFAESQQETEAQVGNGLNDGDVGNNRVNPVAVEVDTVDTDAGGGGGGDGGGGGGGDGGGGGGGDGE